MRRCSANGMLNTVWSMWASYKLQTCTPNSIVPSMTLNCSLSNKNLFILMEEAKMKTMVFEICPDDDYSRQTKFVKYAVHCDADIDGLIIMLSEQGFHVTDVYDEADFD